MTFTNALIPSHSHQLIPSTTSEPPDAIAVLSALAGHSSNALYNRQAIITTKRQPHTKQLTHHSTTSVTNNSLITSLQSISQLPLPLQLLKSTHTTQSLTELCSQQQTKIEALEYELRVIRKLQFRGGGRRRGSSRGEESSEKVQKQGVEEAKESLTDTSTNNTTSPLPPSSPPPVIKYESLATENSRLHKWLTTTEMKCEYLQQQLKEQIQYNTQYKVQISEYEHSTQQLLQQVDRSESINTVLQQNYQQSQTKYYDIEQQYEVLQRSCMTLQQRNEGLEGQNKQSKVEYHMLFEQYQELQTLYKQLQSESQQLKLQLSTIQHALSLCHENEHSLRTINQRQKIDVETLMGERDDCRQRLNDQKQETQHLRLRLITLEAELRTSQQQLTTTQQSLNATQQQSVAVEQQLQQLQHLHVDKTKELNTIIDKLRIEHTQMQLQYHQVQQQQEVLVKQTQIQSTDAQTKHTELESQLQRLQKVVVEHHRQRGIDEEIIQKLQAQVQGELQLQAAAGTTDNVDLQRTNSNSATSSSITTTATAGTTSRPTTASTVSSQTDDLTSSTSEKRKPKPTKPAPATASQAAAAAEEVKSLQQLTTDLQNQLQALQRDKQQAQQVMEKRLVEERDMRRVQMKSAAELRRRLEEKIAQLEAKVTGTSRQRKQSIGGLTDEQIASLAATGRDATEDQSGDSLDSFAAGAGTGTDASKNRRMQHRRSYSYNEPPTQAAEIPVLQPAVEYNTQIEDCLRNIAMPCMDPSVMQEAIAKVIMELDEERAKSSSAIDSATTRAVALEKEVSSLQKRIGALQLQVIKAKQVQQAPSQTTDAPPVPLSSPTAAGATNNMMARPNSKGTTRGVADSLSINQMFGGLTFANNSNTNALAFNNRGPVGPAITTAATANPAPLSHVNTRTNVPDPKTKATERHQAMQKSGMLTVAAGNENRRGSGNRSK